MVIFRSKVSTTKNGRHWGLRRGAAAVALGAVLAATAGVPASHAATGLSAAASAPSAQGSLSLGLDDVLDGLLGSATTPSHSPSGGSDEDTPSRPPSHSSPEPSDPSDPQPSTPQPTAPPTSTPPTSTSSAKPAPPAAPQVPGTPPAAPAPGAPAAGGSAGSAPTGEAPGQPAPGSGSADQTAEPGAAVPAVGSGTGTQAPASKPATSHPSPAGSNTAGATMTPAKGHAGNSSLEATSVVKPAGLSPLVGWGIGLVVFSLGAGVAAVRMRRS